MAAKFGCPRISFLTWGDQGVNPGEMLTLALTRGQGGS